MRVLVVPVSDDDASADLRCIWPGVLAANAGHDVRVANASWTLDAIVDENNHVRKVADPDCDVLVVQRLQSRRFVEAIPLLQRAGVAVVVDADDDFSQVHPDNIAHDGVHPRGNPDHNRRWLAAACKAADLVSCTTPALAAKYGAHGRVAVIPNRLPRQVLSIEHEDIGGRVRAGWAGNVGVHPDDLQTAGGAVARAVGELGCTWTNIGPGGTTGALGLERECVTGFVDRRLWYSIIARELDVAVVPLAPTKFNSAKSALALLTHSSVGVPAIASPTPDNRRLHALGMGVLADTPDDWWHELRRMVTDSGWRAEVAERSKQAARGETLEDHLDLWVGAWERAATFHAKRHYAPAL